MHWLVDDCGDIWPATAAHLRKRLEFGPRSVDECCRYLVTNLGYIALHSTKRGLIVQWRPTFVRRPTFAALLLHLKEQMETRVVISTLRREWSDTLWASLDGAQTELLKEFDTARCDHGGFFRARKRVAGTLPPTSELRMTLDQARETAFRFETFDLWKMLDRHSAGRYIVLEPKSDEQRLQVLVQGHGYPNVGRDWLTGAAGRDFFDQPDTSYAASAARGYWSVIQSGEPLIEDVAASIWWTSRGRHDVQYTRLVLPIDVAGRGQLLLCVSQLRGAE